MVIYELKIYVLTNFHPSKQTGRDIESDHYTEIIEMELSYQRKTQLGAEVFNLKNKECQNAFSTLPLKQPNYMSVFQPKINHLKNRHKSGRGHWMIFSPNIQKS